MSPVPPGSYAYAIIDGSRNKHTLQIKEALHILLAGWDRLFNRDCGTATSECWRCTTVRSIAPPSLDDLLVLTFHSTTCIVLLVSYVLCISSTSVVLFYPDEGSDTGAETSVFCIINFLGWNSRIHSIVHTVRL